ncbi:MAG: alpha/beta fold hydrolase [Xanthomonadales bacterium]|nr:alpha/beta fold hydrolase [Xanthomonadales bacterium]
MPLTHDDRTAASPSAFATPVFSDPATAMGPRQGSRRGGRAAIESLLTLTAFPLDMGGRLARLRAAYRLVGHERAPTVVVLGGISAHRRAVTLASEGGEAGWWQGVLGEEGADLCARYRVLSLDWLGGPDGTTGPGDEACPEPFPAVTTRDQARLVVRLLDHLGVAHVHAVVSASYGGMVAQHLCTELRGRLGRAIIMGCAHRPDAMALARRHIQREILALVDDARGVALARALAMTTYRTGAEFNRRFGGDEAGASLAGYLDYQGRKFARRFNAQSYACLIDSIDAHRFDPTGLSTLLSLLGFSTDELCPPALMRAFAGCIPALRQFDVLETPFGHDAFLCEKERVAAFLHKTLDGESS